ncbi:MAG: ABC transporter ATP-binding protein [Patescibacteria group bacterium]
MIVLTLAGNAITIAIPQLVATAIDQFIAGAFQSQKTLIVFLAAAIGIFIFTYIQSIVQTYASERVARDMRNKVMAKVSQQNFSYVQQTSPSVLLTNLTSDIDALKTFVAQAVSSMVSSLFIIIGVSVLMLMIDWKLALMVLAIIPIIGGAFGFVLGKVRPLFGVIQSVIDRLNKVINESILGAALIRVLNSHKQEYDKFMAVNSDARDNGYKILSFFAALIPLIIFIANAAVVVVLIVGGRAVINDAMSIGDFTAFNAYIAILIFPIIMIGFMSTIIARASASYQRIHAVLSAPLAEEKGTVTAALTGAITVSDISLLFGEKEALKKVSFSIAPGTKNAIIGPTAAGKTQLLYVMTGLLTPGTGTVQYDGLSLEEYDQHALHEQIGFVFQDSVIFNTSVKENIAFSTTVTDESLQKAIGTAELGKLIESLPHGLEELISERGTNLSGGQKQRIMLARALALNPRILFLDDFTARVDTQTEQSILANVQKNYPDLTLVSITQKIAAIEAYDNIIVIMEGELLAQGTHKELMQRSPEYVQIYQSQQSTEHYELQA